VLTVPNVITVLRALLIPVIVVYLYRRDFGPALALFLVAAIGDMLDGLIARLLDQRSKLGAILDPAVDKLTTLAVVVVAAWLGIFPVWLAGAAILRDVVIVGGASAYRLLFGSLEVAPTLLSKVNTFLEFGAIALTLAHASDLLDAGRWLSALYVAVLCTIVASGAQYVWSWSGKAARARRGS
jgi:cardiolipin synthase